MLTIVHMADGITSTAMWTLKTADTGRQMIRY